MNTKKTYALLAAAALSVSALTACTTPEETSEHISIPVEAGGSGSTGSGGALAPAGAGAHGSEGTGGALAPVEGAHGAEGSGGTLQEADADWDAVGVSSVHLDRDGNVMSFECRKAGEYYRDANRSRADDFDRASAYRGAQTAFAEVAAETDNKALAAVLTEFEALDDLDTFQEALDANAVAFIDACNGEHGW